MTHDEYTAHAKEVVERIKPTVAREKPAMQGVVCAELTAQWIGAQPPELRDMLLEHHTQLVRTMVYLDHCPSDDPSH